MFRTLILSARYNCHTEYYLFVTGNISICTVIRRERVKRGGVWDSDDFRTGLHGVRHSSGLEKGGHRDHSTNSHWVHSGRQHFGWWCLWWCIHEPSCFLWASSGELVMGQPLGLLAWPICGLCHCCPCVWTLFY